jgi:hypothetical protein
MSISDFIPFKSANLQLIRLDPLTVLSEVAFPFIDINLGIIIILVAHLFGMGVRIDESITSTGLCNNTKKSDT